MVRPKEVVIRTRTLIPLILLAFSTAAQVQAQDAKVLRSRLLEARPETLRRASQPGDTMPLRLFEDASYEAVLERSSESPHNGLVWRGRLAERLRSWLVLVEHHGVMAGVVSTGARVFRIGFVGAGLHRIEEMDPRSLRWTGDDTAVPELDSDFAVPVARSQTTAPAESNLTEIDVLMVYSRKAARVLLRDRYFWIEETDKRAAMESQARLSIAVANAALENSRIPAYFRLVGIEKVAGRGSGDFSRDLDRVVDPSDGFMDSVPPLRDQLGADFVVLVLGKGPSEVGGTAYVLPSSDLRAPSFAYSVVRSSALWWTTVAHEIGHNMGLVHNPENDSAPVFLRSHRYSRGYRDEANALATLMAYTDGCDDCWLDIPHYSNPKVKWRGDSQPSDGDLLQPRCRGDESPRYPEILFPVCGIATGTADFNSARSIKKDREIFAAFRECRVDCQLAR